MEDSLGHQVPRVPRSEMSWIRRFVDKGEDPPMLFFFLIAATVLGSGFVLGELHNNKFEENVGVVIEITADWDYVEVDGPGCGDEYSNCNKVTKIHCLADLEVQHNVDGIDYTSHVDDWFVYSERDYSNATQSCEEYVSTLEIGSNVTIFFEKDDPSLAYQEILTPEWISYLALSGVFLSIFWVILAIGVVLKKSGFMGD